MAWSSPSKIELTDDERAVLEQRARSSNAPYRDVIRARVVLYAADGMSNSAIAKRLDADRSFVGRVRKRFVHERLKALEERPRSGRPARFPPQRRGVGQSGRL